MNENIKSIEPVIAELNRRDAQSNQGSDQSSLSFGTGGEVGSAGSASEEGSTTGKSGGEATQSGPQKRPSRFWYIFYHILYWSALGSIPVHLLLLKGETKEWKEKQEWKIGVLTEMKNKLERGESVKEEEALLNVGLNRSKREEQVDDKFFEDLLTSAEKLDFTFGKDKEALNTEINSSIAATSTPAPGLSPSPPPPIVPRKPAPPKTEKSFL
ncbi:hypothetical protein BGZ65_011032 [Modicella reniformis]|uniref:Uncharacterized protein n=1 Tax=Modicella reniformis TaxID=1440133 RepID=A0A9P6M7Q4_9FUNG|nr:hypothetical protein BGZ65_011032 [Modicella reniformis]